MAPMDPRTEKVVRRTAMVGALVATYLLLTADYGPNYPNPIKKAMESSQLSLKDLIFKPGKDGHGKEPQNSESDGRK